jgi:hypothetical protein
MSSLRSVLRWATTCASAFGGIAPALRGGAISMLLGVSAGCMPADFDALSRESEGVAVRDACAPVAGEGALDAAACGVAPAPIVARDARVCGPCATGQTCEPCADAEVCENCRDGAVVDANAPSCAEQPGGCELDADVCENCSDSATADAPVSTCQLPTRECDPDGVETETMPCGACSTGTQTRTRSCDAATCTWSTWSDFGECTGITAACTPQATRACANGDSCGHRVCSDSCSWGACQPIQPGGCLRIREGHTDMGSNFRCCGVGAWQFCLPSCTWSAQCEPCAAGAPNYCSECHPPGSVPKGPNETPTGI